MKVPAIDEALKFIQTEIDKNPPDDEMRELMRRKGLLLACKKSMKVVTVDMTDEETSGRMLALAGFLMAMLTAACDSPVEAYTACHLVQDLLAKNYNIAGVQDLVMPTDKLQ